MTNLSDYKDMSVLVTGHTGFKGSWMSLWLDMLGARVSGLALAPESESGLFSSAQVHGVAHSVIGDIRDRRLVMKVFDDVRPQVVIHMAAQSLVRRSYAEPVATFETNVMGTLNILEAARQTPGVAAVVSVTSDKCYENQEWVWGYRENDPMGGADPYSASKGCAELATQAYRRSFFSGDGRAMVASARAGNVIGGGDWAEDRLVPDIARAIAAHVDVVIRNPDAVRPWQHVLDPLRGYLMLGLRLAKGERDFAEGWNFGPDAAAEIPVIDLAERVVAAWGRGRLDVRRDPNAPHEAGLLKLDSSKARAALGFRPLLGVDDAIRLTVDWYRAYLDDKRPARKLVREQLAEFMERGA